MAESQISQLQVENKKDIKPVETEKKSDIKPTEVKTDKKDGKKSPENKPKKSEVSVYGRSLSISIKHAAAICNLIRGKEIDRAINILEEVTKFKRAVPMRGEIPHRKGMMSGRYPVKAAGIIIGLLKSLKSNAIANDLELEKLEIFAMPNVAPRPYKRFGQGRMKRSHIVLKLIPIKIKKVTKNKKKEVKK